MPTLFPLNECPDVAFKYQKRPDDLMLLRVLEDVVYTAFKGKARRLIRYLRSDLPFEELEQYRELLADLIERKVQRKGRGQRGKAVPTLKAIWRRKSSHSVRAGWINNARLARCPGAPSTPQLKRPGLILPRMICLPSNGKI